MIYFSRNESLGVKLPAKAPKYDLNDSQLSFAAFTTHSNVGYAYDLFFLDRIIMMELPHKTLKWLPCNISILCFCTPTTMWDMLMIYFF